MKKKCFILAVVATLVLSLAGCSGAEKDYRKDMDALLGIAEFDGDDKEALIEELNGLKMTTEEGKELKKAFGELFESMADNGEPETGNKDNQDDKEEVVVNNGNAAEDKKPAKEETVVSKNSLEDYESDVDALWDVTELDGDDPEEMIAEFGSIRFVTKEGNEFKKLFEELLVVAQEAYEIEENFDWEEDDYDEAQSAIEALEEKSEEIIEEIEYALEEFCYAAAEAGVDEDDLDDLWDAFF